MVAVLVVLSLTPGIFWLVWFSRYDRERPEPKRLVAAVFFLGMLSALAAAVLNEGLASLLGVTKDSLPQLAILFFVIVGPVEESLKLGVVRVSVYGHREFDEPIDAMVYSAAGALGFASLENLAYGFQFGTGVLLLRALLSVPAHLLFSALWGYGLSVQKFARGSAVPWLVLAMLLHGLFDFFLVGGGLLGLRIGLTPLAGHVLALLAGVLPLLAIMWVLLVRLAKRLQEMGAPEAVAATAAGARPGLASVLLGSAAALGRTGRCDRCGKARGPNDVRFCSRCGAPLPATTKD